MYMSTEQINKEFHKQWVYISNGVTNEEGQLIGGDVVIHSKNRLEVFDVMEKNNSDHSFIMIALSEDEVKC